MNVSHTANIAGGTPSSTPTAISHHQTPAQAYFERTVTHPENPNSGKTGVSLPAMSTPSTAIPKRVLSKPIAKAPGGSPNSSSNLPFKSMELTPAVSKKKRKLTENRIPEDVAVRFPECAIYAKLLEFENRVDAAMRRKKAGFQEQLKDPTRIPKTLRLYVFNCFEHQGDKDWNKNEAEAPSWSLKITGSILEDDDDPAFSGIAKKGYPEFSSFFKKITIYLDQSLYPDNHVILWDSGRSPQLKEGFELKRKGDKEFTAILRLEMNYVPEKFKLSPALSQVLGLQAETQQRVLMAIWQYVKCKQLQDPNNSSFFTCDQPLQKLFGEEKMKFSMVLRKITPHLSPPQPIHLEHRVKVSGNCPSGTTCYDIPVDVPLPVQQDLSAFLASTEKDKDIDAYDEVISSVLKKINEHCRRRAFFLGFSESPATFINSFIASQSKDLKLMAGEAGDSLEKEQQSRFYNQPWVEDAVIRYLDRRSAGSDTLGNK